MFWRLAQQVRFARPRLTRSYDQKVIEHFEKPKNVGSLDRNAPDVGVGLVGAPACGDVMKLAIRVDPTTGTIVESVFKTFGCGSAIASSSYATELIKGKRLEDAVKVTNRQIASELKLPPVKLHCSMLAEDAIRAAVSDYQKKQAQQVSQSATQAATAATGN
ncbi:similar to nifU-like iron-sulfur cluster protein Isu1 [Cyanidioschyzon merolae strain 10D]|jgi:Fe-S cluster assembly scaffold IscU|uniref:Iron-sulfur cluster assembly protein n=1 Tax=Cyanidioschyzon merolae (strain NIES-3377 / 10D) TaxID=280699 RepID=M1VLF3_CYAM1|nr:similar to nifU-like iron-sulfur cluster protein Isu1 [Cyanidioschyzon merolae strain 10D]BAM82528.1 similar to nifU-like iron-sulfur cluster protein Isu1 [Cyanidioschyzon merolae strain 10D]|eukprot:XP_005538564.1 similar to nifU-like iron-sulfur cluster protein Isu1 [Cyanidioschyzon merolae strain 10D]